VTYDLFPSDAVVAADVAPSASPSVLYVREAAGQYREASLDEILGAATSVLEQRLLRSRVTMTSPQAVKDYLVALLGSLQHEVFGVVYLDAQHGVIAVEQLFRGTLTQTSVYPREVLKESLARNASALILWHNHPSGSPEPSRADEFLTQTLKSALALVDVRVLDHMIVAGNKVTSFAERGLL
jgi:DNA repair protein RadC